MNYLSGLLLINNNLNTKLYKKICATNFDSTFFIVYILYKSIIIQNGIDKSKRV